MMKLSIRNKNDFFYGNLFKGKTIWLVRMGMLSIFLFFFNSCGIYSFTGASIPPGAKTVSVQYFPNKAALVEPALSSTFTNALRNIFTTQTNLQMVSKNGDLVLEGEITQYAITPQAIQANQTAASNRLSVTVNVRFINKLNPTKDFETQFTQYMDYPSGTNLSTVKDNLLKQITDNLAQDIFNRAVVNW